MQGHTISLGIRLVMLKAEVRRRQCACLGVMQGATYARQHRQPQIGG